MFCTECGAEMADGAQYCSQCGARAAKPGRKPAQPKPAPPKWPTFGGIPRYPSPTRVLVEEDDVAPNILLAHWKTNVGLSIAGACVGIVVVYILAALLGEVPVTVLLAVVTLVYALGVYPSFFGPKPFLTNANLVSACNLFFGGVVFGCIWNSNLTNRKKGISYVVFAVLFICNVLGSIGQAIAKFYVENGGF